MSTTEQEPLVAETEVAEPEKSAGPRDREYVILEQRAKDGPFTIIKRVTANDVDAALNSLGDNMNQGASYVAVADRYWQPRSPKVETVTTITWT